MFQRIAYTLTAPSRRTLGYIAATVLSSVLLISAAYAQAQPKPACQTEVTGIYKSLVGDWVGTCEQSTDGQQAENKYFHVTIKETGPDTFASTFTYYKSDGATGKPLEIGTTDAVTTVNADGTIKNDIKGAGTIMVEKEPKQMTHTLAETLSPTSPTSLSGQITGKISVSGLPFGIGKNGQISDGKSTYTLTGDTLTISQTLKAGFKVLLYKKSFTVTALSTAKRGSDVASLMQASHVAAKTPCAAPGI